MNLEVLLTAGIGVATTLGSWFTARAKNKAETRSSEIEAEIKAAAFYRSLLDDAMRRLDTAIATITIQEQKIKTLLVEVEFLTDELRKYKQLNGKSSHDTIKTIDSPSPKSN